MQKYILFFLFVMTIILGYHLYKNAGTTKSNETLFNKIFS